MQTQQFDMIELNDEDLFVVSGGQTVAFPAGTHFGVATGTGGSVVVNTAGTITATAGTGGFALGIVNTAPITLTL